MKPMMHILTLFFIVALTVGSQPLCLGDVLYDGDFSTFADGDLAGQDGWEAQLPWQVVGGVVTNSSSFTRARHLASPFAMQPGDVVRYTSEMSFSGTPNGTEFARLGLSKNNEHTGANMPQVFAGVQWSGSNLSVGGVTDTGYDSGDVIQIEITITMGATTNSWQMNVRLSNLTDGTMFEGGTVVVDEAGTVTPETAWEWLDAGGNALFGLRTHNNSAGIAISMANVLFENNLPAEPPLGIVVYQVDFSNLSDGPLQGQDGWEGQAGWQITGGMVMNSGSWDRARQFSPFTMLVDDVTRITTEVSFTGTPGAAEFARIGIAKSNEHTGANLPQLYAGVTWTGNSLTVGGATDSGYDSGDVVEVSLTLTRLAATNSWQMNTRLNNLTDGTSFEGGSEPVDQPGTASPETVWEWLDTGGSAFCGMRMFNNSGGVAVAIKNLLVETGLPTEPALGTVLYTANFCDFADGPLQGQGGFEAQAPWTVASGMATASANFVRARQVGAATAIGLAVGDRVGIEAELTFTGVPGTTDLFGIGFSKSNEHTGATIPQVGGSLNWTGTNLTIGGATDTGYDSGDSVRISLVFTREAVLNEWSLSTTIDNLTDGTSFTGSEIPTDTPGTVTTETAWEWMDGGGTAWFGMSTKNNSGGVVIAMKNLSVVKNPTAAPVGGDFLVETFAAIRGIHTGGTVDDLDESDNVDVTVQRNPAQATGIVEVEVDSTSTIANPTTFEFTLEAAAFFRSTVIQSIEFYDFDAGAFIEVDSRNASRFIDSTVTVSGSGDLSRFVEPGTGRVRTRILYTSVSRRQAFSAAMDHVFWTIH